MPIHNGVPWPSRTKALNCPKGTIRLHLCDACGHIFNAAFDPGLVTYEASYNNALDYSPHFQAYARRLARRLTDRYALQDKRVLSLGCGKGDFLLLLCQTSGGRGIGFDPSYTPRVLDGDLADRVTFVADFYTDQYADVTADFVTCRHVLEHLDAPRDFLMLVHQALDSRPGAAAYFEVPNVAFIVREHSIWDIIYEHYSYFSTHSLTRLFEQTGFRVTDLCEAYNRQFLGVEVTPRAASPSPTNGHAADRAADRFDAKEALGIDAFGAHVTALRQRWHEELTRMRAAGQRVVLWGGGPKAVSFSNVLGLGETVPYVVDINPNKEGAFLAGTGQQIVPPSFLPTYEPDVIIVMNPIYAAEIQQMTQDLGLHPTFLYAS